MSLDVYLMPKDNKALDEWQERKNKSLSEAGSMKGLIPMIEEYYDKRKPDREDEHYWANITHNLNTMAREAGIYDALWNPIENGMTTAQQLVEPLKEGLKKLKEKPDYYKQFNQKNGWGSYDSLVSFVAKYLEACIDYPEALIRISK